MKALIIAEKPSVARDIARVLKCNKKLNGGLEGDKYVVTWGLGHLVTLAAPESYSNDYKEWKLDTLPMMPDKLELEVIKQTSKQYGAVKFLINRNDVNEIIIATDAGREGELVARLILLKAKNRKPTKRLWISSVTDKAIREGFANLKKGSAYDNLYFAAISRAEADWLVGMNATRALTCKYNASLSCGRVQTPTLSMIAKREEEIRSFVPKPFFGITAFCNNVNFTWKDSKSNSTRSFDKSRIDDILKEISNKSMIITEIKKINKKTYAPCLYDLTELQRDANAKFNFSAKETLNIMQRLYENHKVLTYPRTDSRYLTSDIVPTLKERLKSCAVGPYQKLAATVIRQPITAKPNFVNDAKVSDHHAIIPTDQVVLLNQMTNEERKIYDLVIRRFLSVFYPAFEYEQTTVMSNIGKETFTARGKVVLKQGWKEVYGNQYDDEAELSDKDDASSEKIGEQLLPAMKKGDKFDVNRLTKTEGKTKPPAPFNEGTLLSAMENPIKYLQSNDKQTAKTLAETGGLGTVATRADIIEKLFQTFLIEKRGKDIFVTTKAKQLLELVPIELKQPELTADWEQKLQKISKGQLRRDDFMKGIRTYTVEIVDEIKHGSGQFHHDNLTNKKCPRCGKRMLSVNGKNSKMLVCHDRECGYRETISTMSNARCPVCHKKLELYGKGDDAVFICGCGYKEKLGKFKERRAKEGGNVNKKDISNYLNKQKQQEKETKNLAFADALKNILNTDK